MEMGKIVKFSTAGKSVAGAGLALALLLAASPASAAEGDCQAELNIVRGAIQAADFKNDRDQTRLGGKVTMAEGKVALDKFGDAIQKLGDISVKVIDLRDAAKTKIDDDDANDILGAVDDATACLAAFL
jgi:hypothetical protein